MSGERDTACYAALTSDEPGAVAIVQVWGARAGQLIEKLTGRPAPAGRVRLSDLGGLDEGMVAPAGPGVYQIMPHGGRGVVRALCERLEELGAVLSRSPEAIELFPEASSVLEAWMLQELARAASPAAVDWLLPQPERWRRWLKRGGPETPRVLEQSQTLRHLLQPPKLVLAGAANVGKSTLTNRLALRQVSLEQDRPGTTRDWVRAELILRGPVGEVLVDWRDTPGRRDTRDPVEKQAIALSESAIRESDLLILVRDHEQDWPSESSDWPARRLRILNKSDAWQGAVPVGCDAAVSARTGEGLETLGRLALQALGLDDLREDLPWAFCEPLEQALRRGDREAMERCLGPVAGGGGGG